MISFIVPTIGRPSLAATLGSIEMEPGDEILVIGDVARQPDPRARYIPCVRGNDWGGTERNRGMAEATSAYLAFIDDDDVYAHHARTIIGEAIARIPDRPLVFRMQYPNGFILWREPSLTCGNVGTPMVMFPNDKAKLGTWTARRECDFDFWASSTWTPESYHWSTAVIAHLGHDDGGVR